MKRRGNKKIVFITLFVIVLMCSGGIYAYMSTYAAEQQLPEISLDVEGQSLEPQNSIWNVSMVKGLFFFKQKEDASHEPYDIGAIHDGKLPISNSQQYAMDITVLDSTGETIFEGDENSYKSFGLEKNGTYEFDVEAITAKSKKADYGSFHFCFTANLTLEPKIITGETRVVQGDVLAIKMSDVPEGIVPTVKTELGLSVFTKANGDFQAFIPVGYMQKPGKYSVAVTAGDFTRDMELEVAEGAFKEQHLTINKKNPVISEASSPKAYQQFRDTIHPFYETADSTVYWKGNFMQPVQGRISTEYGLRRYTNGSTTPTGHSGIDIAAATGTPISAPAAGVVVFSDYLLNTGNTLVIEHGGGLKSYFYHMDSASVKAGDKVELGQPVGTVGTTGYSTGPHLHYDVRIGNQSLNPWNLFKGTGGFFTFQ